MTHQTGTLDATLCAAAGNDPEMLRELRDAFIQSVARQVDLLDRSRCDGNWRIAAMRLKGLAASFHAGDLLTLAEDALAAAPGEPTVVRALKRFVGGFFDRLNHAHLAVARRVTRTGRFAAKEAWAAHRPSGHDRTG